MANSLIVGGLKVGMNVAVATPDGYKPDGAVLEFTKGYGDKFALDRSVYGGIRCGYSDPQIHGLRWEKKRRKRRERKSSRTTRSTDRLLAAANAGAMVQHCLPAYRGQGDHRGSLRGTCRRDLQ